MSKETYQKIFDEAYENYSDNFLGYDDIPIKEVFILECKTNSKFSERWGLKIEERDLNLDERAKLHPNPEMFYDIHGPCFSIQNSIEDSNFPDKDWLREEFSKANIPIKLISITYNNETLESYL